MNQEIERSATPPHLIILAIEEFLIDAKNESLRDEWSISQSDIDEIQKFRDEFSKSQRLRSKK